MQDWEYLFEDKILNRGYFYTDQVRIIHRDDKKVTAKVRGTMDYQTEIKFDDGVIDDMFCSCPYFDRANCKHLAALLYVLEEIEAEPVEKEDFTQLFNSVDVESLKEFLFNQLSQDDELLNKFKLQFADEVNSDFYKSKLSDICFEEQNRYLINSFLNDDMHFLVEKKEYELVLDLLNDVFPFIRDWWYYWEDYGSDGNMEEFSELVRILIGSEVHDDLFEWLGDLIYEIPNDYHMDDLIDIYLEEFTSTDELRQKENMALKIFEKTQKIKWIRIKIDLMNQLNYPQSQINEFRKNYTKHEEIMQQYIDSTSGDEKEKLLIESIMQFEYNERYRVQLKDHYLEFGNEDKYLAELEKLVFDYPNIGYYREFRKSYKGDWSQKCREILDSHSSNDDFLNECYATEGMYVSLINNIHHLWQLDEYREILIEDFSDELIEKYAEIAIRKAQMTGPPKHYREIAEILKTISNIPGGEDVVANLVDEFKIQYKRRPRMLRELRNAGL